MLDNIPNEPSKFRTKNWIEINDDLRGKSSLCDYSNAYMHVKGTIKVSNTETAAAPNYRNI